MFRKGVKIEKIENRNRLLQKIKLNKELKKQKMELISKYARYWETPNFCKRQLSKLEAEIEINNLRYNKTLKNAY